MSMVQTILVFVVVPLAIYGLISVLTLRTKFAASPRYRPGQEWDYPPVWWSASPRGSGESHGGHSSARESAASGPRGGASGSW